MRWYLPLFSAAWEVPALMLSPTQKAKKRPFKFHSKPHTPRPPQTPAASSQPAYRRCLGSGSSTSYSGLCPETSPIEPSDRPGVISPPRYPFHNASVLGSTCSCQSRHSLTGGCRVRNIKRPEDHVSSNDRPNHLALPHRRETRRRWDGCGLQGRGRNPAPAWYGSRRFTASASRHGHPGNLRSRLGSALTVHSTLAALFKIHPPRRRRRESPRHLNRSAPERHAIPGVEHFKMDCGFSYRSR